MSEVISTGGATAGGSNSGWQRWRLWLLAGVVFVLLFQLGGRGLNEPDEGRYAEAGREMLAAGDYLTPRLNGVPHYAKPPLTYWLIAGSLNVFGVNEFGARLPAALAAFGTLLAVYLIGRRVLGEAGGLWAAVILLTSALFLGVARLITTDMVLTCWVTWSVWALWCWHDSPARRWRNLLPFYIFLGLGLMTKGPVAVVLPLFALAGLRWRNPDLSIRRMGWGRGGLVILAIALPWFVAVTWRQPELWGYFLGREIAGRVLSNVHGRGEAWWFFLPVLAGGLWPWTPWLVLAPWVRRDLPPRLAQLLRQCVVWAGAGLLMFTLSRSKLPTYVLPLFPALALIGALTLVRLPQVLSPERLRPLRRWCGVISGLGLIGVGVALAVVAPRRYDLPVTLAMLPLIVALLVVGAAVVLLLQERRALQWGAGWLAGGTLAVAVCLFALIPRVESHLGGKTPLNALVAHIRAADPAQRDPVLAYGKLPLGLPFYLNRTVLWYRPPVETTNATDPGGFEYKDAASRAANVLDEPAELSALLAGSNRVFCVANTLDAASLMQQFKLHELARDSRRVLLVNQP